MKFYVLPIPSEFLFPYVFLLGHSLKTVTSYFRTTVFVPFTNTWYDSKSQSEVLNFLLFSQLERALSTSGLAGLDTLFAFMIATELTVRIPSIFNKSAENLIVLFLNTKILFSDLKKEVFRHQDSLEALAELDHLTAPTTITIGVTGIHN